MIWDGPFVGEFNQHSPTLNHQRIINQDRQSTMF